MEFCQSEKVGTLTHYWEISMSEQEKSSERSSKNLWYDVRVDVDETTTWSVFV